MNTIQASLHAPTDASDMSTSVYHGTVRFRFQDGVIEYPEIITSTGRPDLDKLMLDQVASAVPPKPNGPRAGEPHDFILDLDMPTPLASFESSIYAAIDSEKVYPKEALIGVEIGTTAVDFGYLDGKANQVVVAQSSAHKDLDKASVNAVLKARLPSAPSNYAGHTLHLRVFVCYSLNDSKNCPSARNVILVQGTLRRY
ncbi:MAG: energy transducer TonB [Bacillota bacterium]